MSIVIGTNDLAHGYLLNKSKYLNMDDKRARDFHKSHDAQSGKDFLREFVYGGMDGGVTTFAVVAGATGAHFDNSVIIILGLANLIADGFSMSVGSYLSIKSQLESYRKLKQYELWGVENIPDMEREEIRSIYRSKGLRGKLLDKVVEVITSDKELWVKEMMHGEFQLIPEQKSPITAGTYTFLSFIFIGSIPLLPFIFSYFEWIPPISLFQTTCLLAGLAFVLVGLIKSYVTHSSVRWAVAEALLLGATAASLAYLVGFLLERLLVN